jgi:putative folate metabolism gamma-glutamate ligase
MQVNAYKTHKITPRESLFAILDQYLPNIPYQSIVVITSKIVSLCQNRVILKKAVKNKLDLIHKEADLYLEGDYIEKYGVCLTIKDHILIPTAGIDESNGNGYYILYPTNLQRTAVEIWQHLQKRTAIQEIGVLITDSHTTPLRRGVTGIALAWCGFKPLFSYIGKPDIFGAPLRVTFVNVLDSLAASAVFMMGEGEEQTPLALISQAPKITFQHTVPTEEEIQSVTITPSEDLYAPLLTGVKWKKGGSHT